MTEHMSVKESWDNIAAAVAANPPATDEDIARVEQRIGATLPADVAQSLRLHNGITESAMWDAFDEEEPPFDGWLLSCDEIIAEWEIWKGLYDTEDWGDSWWTPNLVSMTADGGGNSIVVDARTGEVRFMDHEIGVSDVRNGSWASFLEETARASRGEEGLAADGWRKGGVGKRRTGGGRKGWRPPSER